MKTILIIRHAKTHQADWGEKDFDRKLMARGESNAEETASFLKKKKLSPDLIISSPAKRTRQTARIVAKTVDYDKDDILYVDEIYEGATSAYSTAIAAVKEKKNVVAIVGHNPGISMFSSIMSKGEFSGHMPTGSVVAVQADVKKWSDFNEAEKKLLFFFTPNGHLS